MSKATLVVRKVVKWTLISFGALTVTAFTFGFVAQSIENQRNKPAPLNEVAYERIDKNALYDALDDVRKAYGLSTLQPTIQLAQSAGAKCKAMVEGDYYDHTDPRDGKHGYSLIYDYLPGAGYASENLNEGTLETNKAYVDSWMSSPAHRDAILNPQLTMMGVAVCKRPSQPEHGATLVLHMSYMRPQDQPQPYQPSRAYEFDRYDAYEQPTRCTSKYYSITDEVITKCN